MAIFQALIAFILRSAGRILNTAVAWATILLFGKVSKDRQVYISVMSLGSMVWLIVVSGIAFPSFATFLLSFATLPKSVHPNWVRIAMLATGILLPGIIGLLSLNILDPDHRPRSFRGKVRAIAKGYPYTIGLSWTLLMMLLIVPGIKLRDIARQWRSAHLPLLVRPEDYFDVVQEIQRTLRSGGMETRCVPAGWALRFPTRVLAFFAGDALHSLLSEQLVKIRGKNLEIDLHLSDLAIRGREKEVSRAQVLLTQSLTFAPAYMTWEKEANAIEDRLREIWNDVRDRSRVPDFSSEDPRLKQVDRQIRDTALPYEEWEVLFRKKLLLEKEILKSGRARALSEERRGFDPPQNRRREGGNGDQTAAKKGLHARHGKSGKRTL